MERKEAVKLGLHKFNTGRPCKHGHIAHRYTDSGSCSSCINGKIGITPQRIAFKKLLENSTSLVKLFVLPSTIPAIRFVIDEFNKETFPDIPANCINREILRTRKIKGRKTDFIQLSVIVPNNKIKEIKDIANFLMPEIVK